MGKGLWHYMKLVFHLVQFSMFEHAKQMVLSFLLCLGFCWVLAESYLQDIMIFHKVAYFSRYNDSQGKVFFQFVPYNRGGMGWMEVLFENFFSFLSLKSFFWILLLSLLIRYIYSFVVLPSCSSIFSLAVSLVTIANPQPLSNSCTLILSLFCNSFNALLSSSLGYFWSSGLCFSVIYC